MLLLLIIGTLLKCSVNEQAVEIRKAVRNHVSRFLPSTICENKSI